MTVFCDGIFKNDGPNVRAKKVSGLGRWYDKLAVPTGQKMVWLWTIPVAGAIVCVAWAVLLTSYRKLNRTKFTVLQGIETELPFRPFKREHEVYILDRRWSLSQIETAIFDGFVLL